jgi:SecD/SecF fusion protein
MEQTNIRNRALMITVATALLVWAFFHSGIKLGQDLKGGTTLRFSLDIEGARSSGRIAQNADPEEIVATTLKIIDQRINAHGLAETALTQIGENKFEISLPQGAASAADGIIDVVSQLGDLNFRIEVKTDKQYAEERQRRVPPEDAPKRKGVWKGPDESLETFIKEEIEVWKKARDRGEKYKPSREEYRLVKEKGKDGTSRYDFHLVEEANLLGQAMDGGILENPVPAQDQAGWPVVVFDIKAEYQNVFGQWTGANVGLPMAIILNDEFFSAPVIQSTLTTNVQITLGRGGGKQAIEKEAKALATVLQTGSLKIRPVLEAKTVMGASLAGESRDRGILSVIIAFVLVLLFMLVYYRTSGIIANVALLLNLVMLVGFISFFQAVLTLPGIAGIVLTVGMAVDANILINERIREERRGGRSLRRAVAEGYDRALSAIVDANVTSIITAVFLYNFGSGPVRGFAVTLAIGLVVSMFTSIYVTRTIFEALMKRGIMKDVTSWGGQGLPKVNWVAMRRVFAPISVAGVVFGLLMFFSTDRYTLYDVDFTGGYKLQAEFHDPMSADEVGAILAKESRDIEVEVSGFDEKTQEKYTKTVKRTVGPYPDAQVLTAGEVEGGGVEIKVQRLFGDGESSSTEEEEQAAAFHEYVSQILEERLMPDWVLAGPTAYKHAPAAAEGEDATEDPLAALDGGTYLRIAFRDPTGLVTASALNSILTSDLPFWVEEDGKDVPYKPAAKQMTRTAEVRKVEVPYSGVTAFDVWMLSTSSSGDAVEQDRKVLKERIGEYLDSKEFRTRLAVDLPPAEQGATESIVLSQPFPSEDHIGSSVAQRLKNDAMVALLLSLIGIIVYIGLRFHSRSMGFAAVLCLFHDVAITLGIVAIANRLGIVDAKINLALVAAFLTLVGYSVNDTVVVFDRIRENRGKRTTITAGLLNLSINQTLARTIRTTVTFLLVCVALFSFNVGQRNVLEGFAFVLIIGSVVGTYSTIAISTPLLLYLPWLWKRLEAYAPHGKVLSACATKPALLILTPLAALLWLVWAVAFCIGALIVGIALFVPWALGGSAGDKDDPFLTETTLA